MTVYRLVHSGELPAVRFVCDPDKFAWDGTEPVAR